MDKKRRNQIATILASLGVVVVIVSLLFGSFVAQPAAAQDISPAAIQKDQVGARYAQADIRYDVDADAYYPNFEGYWVNQTAETKEVTAQFTLQDSTGNVYTSTTAIRYQVLTTEDHFLRWAPKVNLPSAPQFTYWVYVDYCVDGSCTRSGRALFDDRVGDGEYLSLTAVIELRQDPSNVCLVQERHQFYMDPEYWTHDFLGNEVAHGVLNYVGDDGWTSWSEWKSLKAGKYVLTGKPSETHIAGIREMFEVQTPDCQPETETPTATPTSTSTSTSTSTTTATPTATRTPVSQGCEYLHAEPNTGKAPLVVTLELRGFGIAMEGGEVRGSNGMVIPVQNSVKLSVVVTESVHFVGTLYDGGKPFTAKQCEADVIVTEDEVTPTPSPVATTGLFFPLVKGGPTVTSTPSMTPSPTPTPVIEKIQGRSCGDPYWKALMNLVLTGKWSVEDDDCSGDELGESYPRVNGKEGHRQIIDALHSFEGGWGLFPDVARYELGNGSAESHTYAVLTNGQQQEIVISNIGRMGTGSPGPIQVIWNGGVVEISAQGVDIAGWWFTPYNARGWQGLEVTKGDTKFLFLQERHHDVYTGWIEYRTPQTSVLGGYWKEAHLLGHLPQNIKDYIIDDSPADAAVNPASLIQTAIAVAAATH